MSQFHSTRIEWSWPHSHLRCSRSGRVFITVSRKMKNFTTVLRWCLLLWCSYRSTKINELVPRQSKTHGHKGNIGLFLFKIRKTGHKFKYLSQTLLLHFANNLFLTINYPA